MARNDTTSAIIDGVLRFIVAGGVLSAVVIAPNVIQALDKPTRKLFSVLDKRAQERELRRVMNYMRRRGLLAEDYEHGLEITNAGRERLERADFEQLEIIAPPVWDRQWRLVLFDVPQSQHLARMMLTSKLQSLGFQLLQQSVWIHPYPCRREIEMVCERYDLSKYVTYIETGHIDHEEHLVKRFSSVLAGE